MHKLEKMYHITYNSWDGYYKVHTPKGRVQFYKDKQGLPFIDLELFSSGEEKLVAP
jgi:hypothetical protein